MSKLTWPSLDDAALTGEQRMLAAILIQALHDATRPGYHETVAWHRRQAQAWLRERAAVVELLDLLGLGEGVYERLVQAAQLEEGSHGAD